MQGLVGYNVCVMEKHQESSPLVEDKSKRSSLVILGIGAAIPVLVWKKPLINAVLLPVHAQTSNCPEELAQAIVNNVNIPEGSSVDIDINIPDVQQACAFTPSITRVTLDLGITSPVIGDLIATLTSPDGNTLPLFNGVCGFILGMDITLDDGAVTMIPNGIAEGQPGCPPMNGQLVGTFSTGGSLDSFNGETPNGLWVLNITNAVPIDPAILNSATLRVTSS